MNFSDVVNKFIEENNYIDDDFGVDDPNLYVTQIRFKNNMWYEVVIKNINNNIYFNFSFCKLNINGSKRKIIFNEIVTTDNFDKLIKKYNTICEKNI